MSPIPWPTDYWPEGVPHEISGFEKPLFHFLNEAARQAPDKVYSLFSGGKRTFRQVRDTADRVANFLLPRGLAKGDRVAIFLPNIPQYPEILFGILKMGGVCASCNPHYTAAELNHQLRDSGARAVLCMDHPRFYPTAVEAVAGTGGGARRS